MAGREKKRPAPMGDAGREDYEGSGTNHCSQEAPSSAAERPAAKSTSVDWAAVIEFLRAGIEPDTWAAIRHACQLHPGDNAAGWRTIVAVAEWHDMRLEPVAAYFGWLHPARFEVQGGSYRVVGPALDYVNIYQGHACAAVVPLDDHETVCALGLCRAQRHDRDRRVLVAPWRRSR